MTKTRPNLITVIACAFALLVSIPASGLAETQGPAIWRVEGGEGDVFLFGTFHLLPEGLEWQRDAITDALHESEVIVIEAPIGDQGRTEATLLISQHRIAAPGNRTKDRLRPADLYRAQMTAIDLGLAWPVLEQMPPWLTSLTMSQRFYAQLGFSSESGIENTLLTDPNLSPKSWTYFETIGEQLGFFADQNIDVQKRLLLSTLDQIQSEPELVSEMLEAWLSGDGETIASVFTNSMKAETPELYETLIEQRNRNWIPTIETMAADNQDYFVAVGAGHIVGENGVVALLKARGYKIDRL
jgi:hypothetical protein